MTDGQAEEQLLVRAEPGAGGLVACAGGNAFLYSARGPGKEGPNEDAAVVVPLHGGSGILAVADGLGGRPAGESASEMALRSLREHLGPHRDGGAPDAPLRRPILDALEETNRRLLELGAGAATTFAATEIVDGVLRPYHVGDSAILVVGQRGKLKLQTVAHSPVGYAVEAGLLEEEEAIHHEERHLISNMVGASDMRIELGSPLRLAPRDTLLLATDGLFDNLLAHEIVDLSRMRSLPEAAQQLADLAGTRMREPTEGFPSKPDDLTFILFRLDPPRRG